MSKLVLRFMVDPNDADYYNFDYEVESVTDAEVIIEALNVLPKVQNYHYDRDGVKVLTNMCIKFEESVSSDYFEGDDGLVHFVVDTDEYNEGLWSPEELKQENLLTPDQFNLLSEVFSRSNEEGFHTIHDVKLLRIVEPEILKEVL